MDDTQNTSKLPQGWTSEVRRCSTTKQNGAPRSYRRYYGPNGESASSIRGAWRLHTGGPLMLNDKTNSRKKARSIARPELPPEWTAQYNKGHDGHRYRHLFLGPNGAHARTCAGAWRVHNGESLTWREHFPPSPGAPVAVSTPTLPPGWTKQSTHLSRSFVFRRSEDGLRVRSMQAAWRVHRGEPPRNTDILPPAKKRVGWCTKSSGWCLASAAASASVDPVSSDNGVDNDCDDDAVSGRSTPPAVIECEPGVLSVSYDTDDSEVLDADMNYVTLDLCDDWPVGAEKQAGEEPDDGFVDSIQESATPIPTPSSVHQRILPSILFLSTSEGILKLLEMRQSVSVELTDSQPDSQFDWLVHTSHNRTLWLAGDAPSLCTHSMRAAKKRLRKVAEAQARKKARLQSAHFPTVRLVFRGM